MGLFLWNGMSVWRLKGQFYEVVAMNSIYMILLGLYLFIFASNINNKYEKANFYKGLFVVGSLLCFFVSIFIHICEAI